MDMVIRLFTKSRSLDKLSKHRTAISGRMPAAVQILNMQFRWVRTGNAIVQNVDLIRERREFMIYSSASNVGELVDVWAAKSFEARGISMPMAPLLSELLTHFDHHCSG